MLKTWRDIWQNNKEQVTKKKEDSQIQQRKKKYMHKGLYKSLMREDMNG